MMDIFLESTNGGSERVWICDYGMTLMRLSYSFDMETPNKERIFQRILAENRVNEENGNLFTEASPESLYPTILQFAQAASKFSNMQLYRREVIHSLFYELLQEFIEESLGKYHPRANTLPIAERDDLEVDFQFEIKPRPVYLFGVRDSPKARLAAISCLEFQRAKIPFKSFVVHEEFENLGALTRASCAVLIFLSSQATI